MAINAEDRPATATRDRASARGGQRTRRETGNGHRDTQLDLLTAALIGVAVGASATILLRRGRSGTRPITPVLHAAGRGARRAGLAGAGAAEWAWDKIPREQIADKFQDYMDSARDTVERTLRREMKALRKAARAQRRRFHL